jgi:hypothetical protein
MDTRDAADRWIAVHTAAWAAHDAAVALELFSEDCVYVWHPFRAPRVGVASIRDYIAWAFDSQADAGIDFDTPLVSDHRAAVEYWMTITQVEESKPFTIAGSQIIEFDEDGRAVWVRDYWHERAGHLRPPTFSVDVRAR